GGPRPAARSRTPSLAAPVGRGRRHAGPDQGNDPSGTGGRQQDTTPGTVRVRAAGVQASGRTGPRGNQLPLGQANPAPLTTPRRAPTPSGPPWGSGAWAVAGFAPPSAAAPQASASPGPRMATVPSRTASVSPPA